MPGPQHSPPSSSPSRPLPPAPPRPGPAPRERLRPRRSGASRFRAAAALVAGGLLVAVLGSCSADGDDAGEASSGADAQTDGVAATGAPEDMDAVGATGGTAPRSSADDPAVAPALQLKAAQLDPRKIIRTGSVAVEADDPAATRDRIAELVSDLGGYLSDETARMHEAGDVDEIRLVLQVPTARFDLAVERISSLGEVKSRSIKAEDVTGLVADVDSRVDTARAALDRLRALLDRATSLGTVIRLEGVLSNRQADLESLLAQQSALAGQTSLGTLEVVVTSEPSAAGPGKTDEARGFLDGLRLGWDGLHDAYVGASTVAGAVIPFALLAALLALPVLVWRRRRVSPRPAAPAAGSQ